MDIIELWLESMHEFMYFEGRNWSRNVEHGARLLNSMQGREIHGQIGRC
jgi:hypothetical protein